MTGEGDELFPFTTMLCVTQVTIIEHDKDENNLVPDDILSIKTYRPRSERVSSDKKPLVTFVNNEYEVTNPVNPIPISSLQAPQEMIISDAIFPRIAINTHYAGIDARPKKHVMLSYQHDDNKLADLVYKYLIKNDIRVWKDTESGIINEINKSMAYGVENASIFIPFMTKKYQESHNCKLEFEYANDRRVSIIPVLAQSEWRQSGSLGLITAGKKWIDFTDNTKFTETILELIDEIINVNRLLKL